MNAVALRDEDGFTLVEMMVVLAVLAVLMVESLSNFQMVKEAAAARAAQSDMRSAFESARVFYAESGVYTADPAQMEAIEPAFAWTSTALDGAGSKKRIFLATADGDQTLVLARRAGDKCYFLRDQDLGAGYAVTDVAPGATCVMPPDAAFSDSWPT
jgi:prepilin-type N-terminal cleavage/methylation domain-containing protein